MPQTILFCGLLWFLIDTHKWILVLNINPFSFLVLVPYHVKLWQFIGYVVVIGWASNRTIYISCKYLYMRSHILASFSPPNSFIRYINYVFHKAYVRYCCLPKCWRITFNLIYNVLLYFVYKYIIYIYIYIQVYFCRRYFHTFSDAAI